MLDSILKQIRELDVPVKKVRFLSPPNKPFIVYFDDIHYRGADYYVSIEEHTIRLELYSQYVVDELEEQIEEIFISHNLPFDKSERLWIDEDNTYMVAFYSEYTQKRSRK